MKEKEKNVRRHKVYQVSLFFRNVFNTAINNTSSMNRKRERNSISSELNYTIIPDFIISIMFGVNEINYTISDIF